MNYPLDGTPIQFTFEVNRAWKRHPNAYARLPYVGPFHDWERANCWAARITWKHNGEARGRYFQAGTVLSRGGDLPDRWDLYRRSIHLMNWLFGYRPTHKMDWMEVFTTTASARVKQVSYDYPRQSIAFTNPLPLPAENVPPSARKIPAKLMEEMQEHGLHGLDGNFGLSQFKRSNCDRCILINL